MFKYILHIALVCGGQIKHLAHRWECWTEPTPGDLINVQTPAGNLPFLVSHREIEAGPPARLICLPTEVDKSTLDKITKEWPEVSPPVQA